MPAVSIRTGREAKDTPALAIVFVSAAVTVTLSCDTARDKARCEFVGRRRRRRGRRRRAGAFDESTGETCAHVWIASDDAHEDGLDGGALPCCSCVLHRSGLWRLFGLLCVWVGVCMCVYIHV